MTLDAVIRELVAQEVTRVLERHLSTASRAELPRYLTTDEAAQVAGVTPETIRDWVSSGRLPEHRAGRRLRVRLDEFEAFLRQRSTARARGPSDADLEERAAAIVRRVA